MATETGPKGPTHPSANSTDEVELGSPSRTYRGIQICSIRGTRVSGST